MQKIKNIIFDLGGIFIEISYDKTKVAFGEMGISNFDDLFTQHTASDLFIKLETGDCDPSQFYDAFRKETGTQISDEQIRFAWNAMLGHFPVERIQWLNEIKKRYRIYLFSNTNIIHYDAFQQIYKQAYDNQYFDDFFIKAYYSHELGARKPNQEAFSKLLTLEKLDATDTLFIDDTPSNIEGAQKAGLQTILLQYPKTVLDLKL